MTQSYQVSFMPEWRAEPRVFSVSVNSHNDKITNLCVRNSLRKMSLINKHLQYLDIRCHTSYLWFVNNPAIQSFTISHSLCKNQIHLLTKAHLASLWGIWEGVLPKLDCIIWQLCLSFPYWKKAITPCMKSFWRYPKHNACTTLIYFEDKTRYF